MPHIIEVPDVMVKCTNNYNYEDRVTIKGTYVILDDLGKDYFIINDHDEADELPKSLFTVLR